MTSEQKEQRKLARMRKPVADVPRSYGPYQMGQYLIARLLADGKAKTMEDLKSFIELCAKETIEDLSDWMEGNGTLEKSSIKPVKTEKQPRKKLF